MSFATPALPAAASPAFLNDYSPKVGDVLAAGTASVKVTMMSHAHVVYVRDGLEYTEGRADFMRRANQSLFKGAVLTRTGSK